MLFTLSVFLANQYKGRHGVFVKGFCENYKNFFIGLI